MGFWTLGSLVGKRRKLVELKSTRETHASNLRLKIRTWKIAPEIIADLDRKIAKLEKDIAKEK